MSIDLNSLTINNYSQERLDTLKSLASKAISIIRLSLEDGPLL